MKMKVREIKALARETLIGRYSTLIWAGIFAGLLTLLSCAAMIAGLAAALNWSGLLAGPDGNGLTIDVNGVSARLYSDAAPNRILSVAGVMVFTLFLILTVILVIWFNIGLKKLMLNICRGDKYGVGNIFYGFSAEAHPFRVILTSIARFLIHNIVGLIAVGIFYLTVKFLRESPNVTPEMMRYIPVAVIVIMALIQLNVDLGYSFAELSIIDKPETRIGAALHHSRVVTKGRKIKILWMILFSFIFWYILIAICRFTALWIIPYIRCAFTILYLDGDGSSWQIPANRPAHQAAAQPQPEALPPAIEEKPAAELEAVAEAAPAVEEAAPVVEEAAPAIEEAAPAVEEAAAAAEEAAQVAEEAAPAVETAAEVIAEEAEAVAAEAEPAAEEIAQAASEEADAVAEEIQAASEEIKEAAETAAEETAQDI